MPKKALFSLSLEINTTHLGLGVRLIENLQRLGKAGLSLEGRAKGPQTRLLRAKTRGKDFSISSLTRT